MTQHDEKLKTDLIAFVEAGGKKKDAAQKFGVSLRTIQYWTTTPYKGSGKPAGRPPKISKKVLMEDISLYPPSTLAQRAERIGVTAQAVAAAMNRYNIKGQHLKGRPSAKISATDLRKNIKNYPKWTIVERAKYFCMDSKTLLKHAEFLGVPVPRAGKKYGRPPTVLLSEVKKYFQLNPEASLTEAANYFGVSTSLICKLLKN